MFNNSLLWSGIAFTAGVTLLQQLPSLPSPYWFFLVPLLVGLCCRHPRLFAVCALALGIFWAMLWAQLRLNTELPAALIGRDIEVIGTVKSIPEHDDRRSLFEFRICRVLSDHRLPVPLTARISWYRQQHTVPPDIAVGQQWRLLLRLKPPVGFMNPGGFDYEGWLFSRNIRASGYVREQGDNQLLGRHSFVYALPIMRSRLLDQLRSLTAELPHQGILLALALGYRNAITDHDWDLLLHTGTNHLMAISGLHIGLVAGLVYWLVLWCTGLIYSRSWCRRDLWPAQRVAALVAWLAALWYAFLAGFALPTQRAVIMITVGLYAMVAYRQTRPAQALSLALIAVLLFDPFAVNSAGFWLSFGAVAVLVYSYTGRHRPPGGTIATYVLNWGKVQLVLLIGLLPVALYWFGAAAATASAANLVAIPLVGFVVVPLVLLATLFSGLVPSLAGLLLHASDIILSLLWQLLEWMQGWPLSRWEQPQPPLWAVLAALFGAALLLAPRALPARWVGLIWLAPLLFYTPARPQEGELWLTALDVGQGTSVVVQTANHDLIYDAGPKFSERFDAGDMVVLPFLRHQGITKADVLLISHGDNDHSGGSGAILNALKVNRVIGNVPAELALQPVESCHDGQHWEWDGIRFKILHPDRKARWEGNDSSCVLLIENGEQRVLLTGDIEARAEGHLLREHVIKPVGWLLAPHHGSRSSSTPAFVEALQPEHVVFAAGLFNRYGFPNAEVMKRYSKAGSHLWTTGKQGAMTFLVTENQVELQHAHRLSARRYWYYRPFAAPN